MNDKVTLLYIEIYLQNKKVNEYSTKDFIGISLGFHQDFTRISAGFHSDFIRISFLVDILFLYNVVFNGEAKVQYPNSSIYP